MIKKFLIFFIFFSASKTFNKIKYFKENIEFFVFILFIFYQFSHQI